MRRRAISLVNLGNFEDGV